MLNPRQTKYLKKTKEISTWFIFKNIAFIKLKSVNPHTEANKDLKAKVFDYAGDIFNELYYIYKKKYEEEKDALNEKEKKKLDYTKLRVFDDYEYESEEEEKETDKKLDKKEPPKPTKNSVKKLNELINERRNRHELAIISKEF